MGLSLAVSLAIVLPFFWYGSASGHDFEFHADSWVDVAHQWREGVVYPRWAEWANKGFGEPRFIFYPPLSWMLGAALTRLLPVAWAPWCFVVLTQTLAGFAAYVLLRRLVSERAATLAGACYAINPNVLLMTYVRSDFAEQLACAIFPFALLGALRVAGLLQEPEENAGRTILKFSVPFTLVWLSNAPAGVIITYSSALLIAWGAATRRSWRAAWQGAAAMALGFGLCGFYLIPAAYEQRWVNIGQVLASGLRPAENFLFTYTVDPEHSWFNWIASFCALILIVGCGSLAVTSRRFAGGEARSNARRPTWNALLALAAATTLLMLRVTLPLWDHLPKLRFVQFPWRWISMLALVTACFLAAVLEKRRGWLVVVLLVALAVPLGHFLAQNTWWDPEEMPQQLETITEEYGYDGTDEYDPLGDDHSNLKLNEPEAKVLPADEDSGQTPEAKIKLLWWSTEKKIVQVETKEPARVALRLLNYPAWRVELNGEVVTPEDTNESRQMVVPVEEGTSRIEVRFTRTADRSAGIALTMVSVAIAGGLLAMNRRKRAVV